MHRDAFVFHRKEPIKKKLVVPHFKQRL